MSYADVCDLLRPCSARHGLGPPACVPVCFCNSDLTFLPGNHASFGSSAPFGRSNDFQPPERGQGTREKQHLPCGARRALAAGAWLRESGASRLACCRLRGPAGSGAGPQARKASRSREPELERRSTPGPEEKHAWSRAWPWPALPQPVDSLHRGRRSAQRGLTSLGQAPVCEEMPSFMAEPQRWFPGSQWSGAALRGQACGVPAGHRLSWFTSMDTASRKPSCSC